MKEILFEELKESIKEMKAIQAGDTEPARETVIETPEAKKIREAMGLSQSRFAMLLGVSVKTLQGWEQRQREPTGPARSLLRVAEKHPNAVLDANC